MTERFINLIVATTSGDLTDRFNTNQPLKVVYNRALAEVGGGVDHGAFSLEYEGTVLDLDRRIGDYVDQFGWTDGTVLELVPAPVVIRHDRCNLA